ncbi:MAG: DUF1311 domain-containing protein [Oscillospiraceae bacterium]|nr:DUF1311 domain-containing protein [Oscillospiraceae bacterium]
MKQFLSILLATALLLSCTACAGKEPVATITEPESIPTTASTTPPETMPPTPETEAFSFQELEDIPFVFSSGAGGWRTELTIGSDGSFSGFFRDSNMGITEAEYPNGCISSSEFTGVFRNSEPIDPYSYRLTMSPLTYAVIPGTEEIRDGILYSHVTAYGLDQAGEMLLYLPGTPLSTMTEDFLLWTNLQGTQLTELPFWALYDPHTGNTFVGGDPFQEIREMVPAAEEADAEADLWLQTHYTQADMNDAAFQRYQRWDDILNAQWAVLKNTLPEEVMRDLTNEELQWIRDKEQAVKEAGAEVEGGSLYPTVTNSVAANLTRDRVYDLLEYFP